MNEFDLKVRKLKYFWGITSILLTILPVLIFWIKGWILGDAYSKTVLGITFTAALVLTVLSIAMKFKCRTLVWLLLIGIYIALGNIKEVLIILIICSALDEFVATPMYVKYKEELKNRTIYRKIQKEEGK